MLSNKINSEPENKEILILVKLINSHKYKLAEDNCKKLLRQFPNSFNLFNYLGLSLANQNQIGTAINSYKNAIKIKPDFAQAYNNLGITLKNIGKIDEAINCYSNAIKYKSDFAEAYNNLGLVMMDQGKIEEAKSNFKKAINIKPNLAFVHRHLSIITKYTKKDSHIQEMRAAISNTKISAEEKMHIAFGLGKAHDDTKDYKNAFNYFKLGNDLRRKKINYDIKKDIIFFNTLKKVFNKNFLEKHKGFGNLDKTPIFIVGMYRSGTTLVEQILSSHTKVFGGGESQVLNQVILKFLNPNIGGNFLNNLENFDLKKLQDAGNAYISAAKNFQPNYEYITDKQPSNFVWLGFIKLILPNSKIIHCTRNPMDNCMSIYKNYFQFSENPYAYNLEELGQYYILYKDLMKFWHSVMPNCIYDISYENLVENQKEETKKLLNACNLEWDDKCMSFYKSGRYVNTASLMQVRKPMYKNSVSSWKNYEKYIENLTKILQ